MILQMKTVYSGQLDRLVAQYRSRKRNPIGYSSVMNDQLYLDLVSNQNLPTFLQTSKIQKSGQSDTFELKRSIGKIGSYFFSNYRVVDVVVRKHNRLELMRA